MPLPIRFGHVRDVVAFDRFNEAFGHAIALRAAQRCGHRLQADLSGKYSCLFGDVGRAVIAQPLHRRGGSLFTKAVFDGPQHQVADVIATVACRALHPADGALGQFSIGRVGHFSISSKSLSLTV